jgi:hypothetical protein
MRFPLALERRAVTTFAAAAMRLLVCLQAPLSVVLTGLTSNAIATKGGRRSAV